MPTECRWMNLSNREKRHCSEKTIQENLVFAAEKNSISNRDTIGFVAIASRKIILFCIKFYIDI